MKLHDSIAHFIIIMFSIASYDWNICRMTDLKDGKRLYRFMLRKHTCYSSMKKIDVIGYLYEINVQAITILVSQ